MKTLAAILLASMGVFFHGVTHNSMGEARDKEVPFQGGVYRRPLESMPRTFDPALARDIYSITIIQQLFDGLIQIDQNLNVIPAIAKSWKISPDGLTYTFFLREGVKFHNGREIVAEDFVYSFTRMADPKNKSPATHLLEKVVGFIELQEGKTNYLKGLKSVDQHTFEIRLSDPFYPFISVLGTFHFKVVPKEEIEKWIPFFLNPSGQAPINFFP
jgi:peptide/nickel transport system substrate-binding protein/oligopeptide transport system substrate-binding protein